MQHGDNGREDPGPALGLRFDQGLEVVLHVPESHRGPDTYELLVSLDGNELGDLIRHDFNRIQTIFELCLNPWRKEEKKNTVKNVADIVLRHHGSQTEYCKSCRVRTNFSVPNDDLRVVMLIFQFKERVQVGRSMPDHSGTVDDEALFVQHR